MIMTDLLMSFGYVVLVMVKFIEKKLLKLITWKPKAKAMATGRKQVKAVQRERTNLEALLRDVMFRPTEETCRVIQKWITAVKAVSKLAGLKVTERLRHTAGCSFYQGWLYLALNKFSLIEVDISNVREDTAQAGHYTLAA